jgi:hypothetical protein
MLKLRYIALISAVLAPLVATSGNAPLDIDDVRASFAVSKTESLRSLL